MPPSTFQAYRLGRGVKVDLAKAQEWLELAARAGHLDAQTTLGLLLFDNGNRAQAHGTGVQTCSCKTASPASGPWRIQLGAFSKRTSAEALFRRLSGAPPVAGRRPFMIAAGAVTRLQVGPFGTGAEAASACAALSARGQARFPVAGK